MKTHELQQKPSGGEDHRLVRRLLVMLEGTDYKERFERLAKHYALDLTEAHEERDEARELCRWANQFSADQMRKEQK